MKNLVQTSLLTLVVSLGLNSCITETKSADDLKLIPYPNEVTIGRGFSKCKTPFSIVTNGVTDSLFNDYLQSSGLIGTQGSPLAFVKDTTLQMGAEQYELNIGKDKVTITAAGDAGLFYGFQTLLQLVQTEDKLPVLTISDSPRFDYRGMHLDVSRHFYSTDFIKKQLDLMAFYKMNYFHWHLTDGAGWRLEIKKYPLLTDVAAWRPYATWKDWWKGGNKYCSKDTPGAQGGYYTQEEAKEIVAYAAQRHIIVVPEIELPAHSEEVLAVYPELSCTGEPYKHADFCVGNEKTFEFLQDVFDEVISIFPSELVHLGGDEAGKGAWKKCPKCQKRMKDNNLKDVDELQSYMIGRMGQYLMSKGKTFIGWDEILEGGLAEGAVVMSWRGEEGGIKSVKMGHRAIMTPGGYCYFDAYQKEPSTQPEAIGGYLPVEKVYSYNPVPDSLTTEEAKLIMGVQGNVWTEYIPTAEHAEYMIHPRMEALAEVAWNKVEKKSWENFKPRINKHIQLLQERGVNVCTLSPDVVVTQIPDTLKQCMRVEMKTDLYPAEIRYTLDGSTPDKNSLLYTEPLEISERTNLTTVVYQADAPAATPQTKEIFWNKAIGKKLTYNTNYSGQYPAGGDKALNNGLYGGFGYGDGRWQGFLKDMDVIVDMGEPTEIHRVKGRFMQIIGPWVWLPMFVEIQISDDGENFTTIQKDMNPVSEDEDGVIFRDFGFEGDVNARYVRYFAKYNGKGFLFIDELVID
ncbi:MAG: family 20 glycosylhydrolase [Bacteroidales bacterium]